MTVGAAEASRLMLSTAEGGGTAAAAVRLLEKAKADVVGCAFLIELAALGGRKALSVDRCHSVLFY